MPTLDDYELELRIFRAKLGAEDMLPIVYVERDERIIAMLFAANLDRDEGLQLARIARTAFGADAVVLAMDARMRFADIDELRDGEPTNPATGEPLQRGDLAALDAAGLGAEHGITEAIAIVRAVHGAEAARLRSLPYRVLDGTVEFLPAVSIGGATVSGYAADGLLEAMKLPFAGDSIPADVRHYFEGLGMSREDQDVVQRAVATKLTANAGFSVLLYATEHERDIYTEHLPDHPSINISADRNERDQTKEPS